MFCSFLYSQYIYIKVSTPYFSHSDPRKWKSSPSSTIPPYSLPRQLKFKCLFSLSFFPTILLSNWLFLFLVLKSFSSFSCTPEIWESIRQRIYKVFAICLTRSPPPPPKTQPIPDFTMSSFSPIGNRKKVI